MSEIDFDELDKAVNNLMGNVKGPKNSDDEPKAKTLEVKESLKPGEEPEYHKLGEAAQKIGNEAQETDREQILVEHFEPKEAAAEPEYKKLGEVAKKIGSETLGSERDDTIIKHMASSHPITKSDDEPAKEEAAEEATPPTQPSRPPGAKRTASGRFMDVVHPSSDMRTVSSKPSMPVPDRAPTPAVPAQSTTGVELESADEQDLTTPFLPDANDKIEKRPLGAMPSPFSDEAGHEEESNVEESAPTVVETNPINSEETSEKKPDTDDFQRSLDAEEITTEPTPEEQALQKIEAEEVHDEPPVRVETIETVESGDTENLRDGSDEPNKDKAAEAKPAGAIFDVEEYHKPLNSKKQKSGWGKVVIILLIIIICAALAGAAYFILGMGL